MTGASGFIGTRIVAALAAAGCRVICGVRDPAAARRRHRSDEAACEFRAVDFARLTQAGDWLPLLGDVDVVVNAVGIFREHGHQTFDLLHRRAPIALFEACARSTVRAVIQLSALGADAHATTAYHLSKRAADERLSALDVPSAILQPSLVYGAGGVSAAFFGMLSTMPVAMLPDGGHQPVQPVHVDDVADTVARLATMPPDSTAWPRQRVAVVGPQPLTLRDYLQALRQSLGHGGRLHVLPVPASWMQLALPLAGLLSPGLSLDRDALAMLARGNAADAADTAAFAALLGRPPRAVAAFVPKPWREAARQQAVLGWQLPILRLAIALVWIITGIVSLGLYPVEQSHALLARAGVPASLRPLALYGAAVLDLVLGVLCLSRWRLRGGFPWVWAAQAALILGYTVIISVRLPEFWLHPYGPLTKNLPMLAALWLLGTLERKRWTT